MVKRIVILCVLIFIGTVSFAQKIPVKFNTEQIISVEIYDFIFFYIGKNTQRIDPPVSFFLGNGTSQNPGICNWLISNYKVNIGDYAYIEYRLVENGIVYNYWIQIYRDGRNEFTWYALWIKD
jgi:hypothetical protein